MPNDTRSGLKISGNRSDGGMNPPQSPELNIIEAVWDHLDRERNKRQPASKEELWDSFIPRAVLAGVASLLIQNETQDRTTVRIQGM